MRAVLHGGIVLAILVSSSFHIPNNNSRNNQSVDPPFFSEDTEWVDSVFKTLSLDEKIAQMFMIAAYLNMDRSHEEELIRTITKHKIGGVIFFQGGPKRQAAMVNRLQEVSEVPLLMAIDAEWGLGMRLDSTLSYPRQMMLGAIQDDSLIYYMGRDIAIQLKQIGVQMNFAPVVDINNNPWNPVINDRSFGEDKHNVARKAIMYMKGMQDERVLCTAKHFPGHGDTDTDSHNELPVILHGKDRLESVELYPFKQCIQYGLTGIMAAHLSIPSMDSTVNLASSLSPKVIEGLLRNQMGFKGLIVTDALNMKAVSDYFKPGETEAMAAIAGNDILLMPADVSKAIHAIRREIRRGTISRIDIDKRCKRILAAKKWVGLDEFKPLQKKGLEDHLDHHDFRVLQSRLTAESLTLLRNEKQIMPLQRLDTLRMASLTIGQDSVNTFQHYLGLYGQVDHFLLSSHSSEIEYDSVSALLKPYNLVFIGIPQTSSRISANYGITDEIIRLAERIAATQVTILNLFANPYSLNKFRHMDDFAGLVVAYEDNEITQRLCPQLIFGGIPANGFLPVSAGGIYKPGDGLTTGGAFRLGYALPGMVRMDPDVLKRIDTIVWEAIDLKAIPGCQVLVARNGSVVYHKAYGYHTYSKKKPVLLQDIYDIASVTKIVSTLPILMNLAGRGLVNVNDRLGKYLPYLDSTNKGDLIIREILAHQSGLQPWIPFYYSTLETMDPEEPLTSKHLSAKYPFMLSNHVYLNKNIQYKEGVYNREFSEVFSNPVADCIYLNRDFKDTIIQQIIRSELLGEKEYRYSDLGYYFFREIIEALTDTALFSYAYQNFYHKLGANFTGYFPLQRFSRDRIVPTENDVYFRRQLLHGYVHDPGAAMLGGVAGHAGIFSNANDLAKIMQMYLNKGWYAGERFLKEEVFDLFNTCPYQDQENRRALGFDKAEPDPEKNGPTCDSASVSSFGHTGFTGTMAWADPENGTIYIFLSNRIHPDQYNLKLIDMNVRTRIQQVIYDAIEKKTVDSRQ
jgi:beta-N-acetylhexosaminidase